MKRFVVFAVLGASAAAGCSGHGDPTARPRGAVSPTEHRIAKLIGEKCKTRVVHERFPADSGHARFRALAERTTLIRCAGRRDNLSAYASFESRARLNAALRTIVLPHGRVEQFCLTAHEAFTTDFWGSVEPACKRARGHVRDVHRAPLPSSVTNTTYVPNCGNTYYLEVKPRHWSTGCTAGSVNVDRVSWRSWRASSATATGRAVLRGPCDPDCLRAAVYRAPARVRLDRPRRCIDRGAALRYFGRARFTVWMRRRNPFGEPPGWRRTTYHAHNEGACQLLREDPLSDQVSG